jgi:hypothetical protein
MALLLAALATPSFELWALTLRKRSRPHASADGSAPHVLLWAMQLAWLGLLLLLDGALVRNTLALVSWPALAWLALVAASLPLYVHFGLVRYAGPAARSVFVLALGAHLTLQLIAIACLVHHTGKPLVSLCVLPGLVVPAWTAWRLWELRRRVLAPA